MSKKNSDDDLIGFKDFLENKPNKQVNNSKRRVNDFELLTFLEQDSKRISNHIEVFEEKVYVIKNYSQDVKLLTDMELSLTKKKADLICLLERKNSPLIYNLDELFNKYFSS